MQATLCCVQSLLKEKISQATVDKKDLFVSGSAYRNPFAGAAEDLQHLSHVEKVLFAWTKQSSVCTNAHRPSGPDAPGMLPLTRTAGEVPRLPNPAVSASFMTRISSDDDPWRPNGNTCLQVGRAATGNSSSTDDGGPRPAPAVGGNCWPDRAL